MVALKDFWFEITIFDEQHCACFKYMMKLSLLKSATCSFSA